MKSFINNLIQKDSNSWDKFVEDYAPLILSLIKKREYQNDTAEDILCYIFEKLIENDYKLLRNFKGNNQGSFLLYIKSIVKTKTIDYLKSVRKTIFLPDYENIPNSQFVQYNELFNPEQEYSKKERVKLVERSIGKLSLQYREVVHFYLKEYSLKEISALLGVPYKTIETRFSRAKNQLKSEYLLKDLI